MSLIPTDLSLIFDYINCNEPKLKARLKSAVDIPSISSIPENRDDVIAMVYWTEDKLKRLGASTELVSMGMQELSDKRTLRVPPVIFAEVGTDPDKVTILVYCHLDVHFASHEGWSSPPFKMEERNGYLYGRGVVDDKGSLISWFSVLDAYKACDIPLPVNIKFMIEGMGESGSYGLDKLMDERKESFLSKIDYVCLVHGLWCGMKKPCLTYALRGVCYFNIEISGATSDLHSGAHGGCLVEPMTDIIYMLNSLIDRNGEILIPHLNDDVLALSDEETRQYKNLDFNVLEFKKQLGAYQLLFGEDKTKVILSLWGSPSLSIHGIEGAFGDPGMRTNIASNVIGKFSIRIVPNMTPEKVEKLVLRFLTEKWVKRGSPNRFKAYLSYSCSAWLSDTTNKNFLAAKKAIKHAYDTEPEMIRGGCTFPIILKLQSLTKCNIVVIPMGSVDGKVRSTDEKLKISNFIGTVKLLAGYLFELAKQKTS